MSATKDGRGWIPERVTKETRRFELCARCGVPTAPSWGKPRTCRDCYEVERADRAGEAEALYEQGMSVAAIARELGVNRKTVDRWKVAWEPQETFTVTSTGRPSRVQHGTDSGYYYHLRHWKTVPCEDCLAAHREARNRQERRRRKDVA